VACGTGLHLAKLASPYYIISHRLVKGKSSNRQIIVILMAGLKRPEFGRIAFILGKKQNGKEHAGAPGHDEQVPDGVAERELFPEVKNGAGGI